MPRTHVFGRRGRTAIVAIAVAATVGLAACSGSDGTATEPPPPSNTALRADGVGPYRLGDPASLVIDGVSSLIGGFDGDSEGDDGTLEPARCGEEVFRQVSWGNLVLFFRMDGNGAFTAWAFGYDPILGNSDNERGLALATEEGIGLGSTRSELLDAYRGRVEVVDDATIDVASFAIDASRPIHMIGGLSAADDPEAVVLSLESAPGCAQPLP